jgi:hypothetical protein
MGVLGTPLLFILIFVTVGFKHLGGHILSYVFPNEGLQKVRTGQIHCLEYMINWI